MVCGNGAGNTCRPSWFSHSPRSVASGKFFIPVLTKFSKNLRSCLLANPDPEANSMSGLGSGLSARLTLHSFQLAAKAAPIMAIEADKSHPSGRKLASLCPADCCWASPLGRRREPRTPQPTVLPCGTPRLPCLSAAGNTNCAHSSSGALTIETTWKSELESESTLPVTCIHEHGSMAATG